MVRKSKATERARAQGTDQTGPRLKTLHCLPLPLGLSVTVLTPPPGPCPPFQSYRSFCFWNIPSLIRRQSLSQHTLFPRPEASSSTTFAKKTQSVARLLRKLFLTLAPPLRPPARSGPSVTCHGLSLLAVCNTCGSRPTSVFPSGQRPFSSLPSAQPQHQHAGRHLEVIVDRIPDCHPDEGNRRFTPLRTHVSFGLERFTVNGSHKRGNINHNIAKLTEWG